MRSPRVTTALETEWEGLEDFAPGGQCTALCTAFRANLVEFLTLSVQLTSAILEATDAPNPDLSQLIASAQAAPPRTLYPVYRMFQEVLESDIPARLTELVPETTFALGIVIQASQNSCGPVVTYADRIKRWSSVTMGIGVFSTVVGKVFNALGATEIEGSAGAMGFAGGTIKANFKKKIGEVFTGLGTMLDKVATFGSVSTRASQASVDEVHTTLQGVARDVSALVEAQGGGSSTTRQGRSRARG